jgi:putative heme-binding domain-containing protein
VWVVDWYNIIVQHNPTPQGFRTGKGGAYESELRDKKYGRVYRLVPTGQKAEPTNLSNATDDQLVAALKDPTMLWRLHAQRLLVERKAAGAAAALAKLVDDPAMDEAGLNVGAIHALWTLGGLGLTAEKSGPAAAAVANGLDHKSAAVRRAAVQVMPPTQVTGTRVIKCYELFEDPDPQVRLAAMLAASEVPPSATAGEHIADALATGANLDDRWLPDALTAAAATHDVFVLNALAGKKLPVKAYAVVAVTAEHLARRAPAEGLEVVIAALPSADPKLAETVIAGLAKGWPKAKPTALTPDAEKALADLLAKLPAGSKGQLLRLASAWGSSAFEKHAGEIAQTLTAEVGDVKLSDERRVAAARQLTEFRTSDAKVVETVLDAITLQSSPALATGLVEAAGSSTAPELGPAILSRYSGWSPTTRAAALRVLLARPDTTRTYLDAATKGSVLLSELALDQRQALAAHPDVRIAARAKALLAQGGGLPNADRQKVIDELLPIVKKAGDAANGKAMFAKHCSACHMHSGEGNKIGPDLTGMAVHPKDHLIVDILDPSRSVEGNFRLYQVRTLDGKVLNGMLASETKTSVELIDSQAKRQVLLREDIDSLTASTKSLMPDGFEKQMNPKELTDLLEFLTKRGKYLPIPLDKAATAVSTKGMFYSEDAPEQRLVFRDWTPKTVDGVPFVLVDPQGDKVRNVILLNSPAGKVAATMPKSATVPVNSTAKAVHILGGVSGWGYPYGPKGTVSMKVRLVYEDGKAEDHALKNGEHLADYIRRVDVPGSKFAIDLGGRQVRYLTITPQRPDVIKQIEFVKGDDQTAPIIVAVTVEGK